MKLCSLNMGLLMGARSLLCTANECQLVVVASDLQIHFIFIILCKCPASWVVRCVSTTHSHLPNTGCIKQAASLDNYYFSIISIFQDFCGISYNLTSMIFFSCLLLPQKQPKRHCLIGISKTSESHIQNFALNFIKLSKSCTKYFMSSTFILHISNVKIC